MVDQPRGIRKGEELNVAVLTEYLRANISGFKSIDEVLQFPGGFSNLTYLLKTNLGEWVLRRPPFGAKIKSGHDMSREFRVLSKLQGIYGRIPRPIHFCEDETIIGGSFYLMERVKGVILRNKVPDEMNLSPEKMRKISEAAIDNLAMLHQIDIDVTELRQLGKPDGYIERQVTGWTKRYAKSQTDEVQAMSEVAQWLSQNMPQDKYPGLIHNDYKYDNLVLDSNEPARILAVLDWEMATIGDTRMDLGTTLAYWTEPAEAKIMTMAAGNLTWLPGNLNRQEVVARYSETTGNDIESEVFFFVFGAFKIAVIVQQIYARWKKGLTADERFSQLDMAVNYFGTLGQLAIQKDRISNLIR